MEDVTLKGFDLRPAQEAKRQPKKPQVKPGKIYTFYSFKGGVGRSMAMANVAVLLAAQCNKVLMIDFDLEAPGLEHFFFPHDPTLQDRLRSGSGLIDLLTPKSMDWRSVVTKVNLDLEALSFAVNEPNDGARLDIIQSGRASRAANDYTQLVQNLNWDDLYSKHDIGNRFGAYRGEWLAEYDYVLIDSRTGVTDSGDLCTVILPDHLVLLFVTNQQNIDGVAQVYERAVAEHAKQPFDRGRLTVLPVLSRDEFYSENTLSREWRRRAADQLAPLFRDWLPEGLRPVDAFQKVFIPYFAIWSFGEALPVLTNSEEAANPSSINAAYSRLARLILGDLDWSSIDALADPAEISSTRIAQKNELEETYLSQHALLEREREEFEAKARLREERLERERLEIAEKEQEQALRLRQAQEEIALARELSAAKGGRRGLMAAIVGISVVAAVVAAGFGLSLRQNATTIEAALAAERTRIEELTADRDAQSAALAEARTRITSFEAQVAALIADRDGALDQVAGLEGAQAKLLYEQETLNLALAQAQNEIDAGTEAARLAAARTEALEALIADLRARNTESAEAATVLQADLDAAREALSAEEAARLTEAAASEAMRIRLESADAELTAMTLALEAQRREAEVTLTLLAEARSRMVPAQARIEELTDELEAVRVATHNDEARITDWQSRSAEMARQVIECERRIETAATQFKSYADEVRQSFANAASASPLCQSLEGLVNQIADPDRYIQSFQ